MITKGINMRKSKYTQEQIQSVIRLKDAKCTHRDIAELVFGRRSQSSSVGDILKKHHSAYNGLQPRCTDVTGTVIASEYYGIGDSAVHVGEDDIYEETYPRGAATSPVNNLQDAISSAERLNDINIVSFDIETAPMLSYHWGLFKQFISLDQIKEDWYPLMFSYKELGEPVQNVSLRDFEGYVSGNDCEEWLVEECWRLFDDADILIAHNGRRFDKKKMNAKFLEFGLPEPSPYKLVDTLEIAKNNFALTSNKLDYLMRRLLNDHKLDTGGFDLWIGCMEGNDDAWDVMEEYCNKDTTGLEEVYLKLRAWDKRAPNVSMHIDDGKEHCVVCGGTHLVQLDKTHNTGVSSFTTLRCTDCGHVNRRRKNTRSKQAMQNTLMNVMIG